MVNYRKGKIYRIVCNTTGKQYIGSTTNNYLCNRLANHVCKYKMWKQGRYHFVSSFEVIKENNYSIVLIEKCACTSKNELHARERYYIESLECVNMQIPNRDAKEYYEDNKEQLQKDHKQYYRDNKQELNEQQREKILCSHCAYTYTRANKSRHMKSEQHTNVMMCIRSLDVGESFKAIQQFHKRSTKFYKV